MALGNEISISELTELLKSISNVRFGIGVHSAGLKHEAIEDREQVAKKILEDGLRIEQVYSSILGNCQSLGRNFDLSNSGILKFVLDDISKRFNIDGNRQECKMIIAVPTILLEDRDNPNSSKEALGFSERSIHSGSKQYNVTSLLDIACKNLGEVPKEFILGYVIDGKDSIVTNPDFYGFIDLQKQKDLFNKIQKALGEFQTVSGELASSNSSNKDSIVEKLSLKGIQNSDKLVESILEENARLSGQKETNVETKEDKQKENIESIESKLGAFYDATYPRKLIFRRLDADFAKKNFSQLEAVYLSMDTQDVMQVDDNNARAYRRTIEDIKKLPKDLRIDSVLKEDLTKRIESLKGKTKPRMLVTEEIIEERKEIESQFQKYISAYLMLGGKDVYRDSHELIESINQIGIQVNVGKSVINYGQTIADRMEELNNTSNRNGEAWNQLLEQVIHAYTISKEVGNERHNESAHKEFENQLIKLGIIEREKLQLVPVKVGIKEKLKRLFSRKDDKDKPKQTISVEQQKLNEAINAYINTGFVPNGYVMEDNGRIRIQTELEIMRKEQAAKNMELQRAREIEEKNKIREQQRLRIGIDGQQVAEPPKRVEHFEQRLRISADGKVEQPGAKQSIDR